MSQDTYDNPLISRYATREMAVLFGQRTRIGAWRRLWLWLAEAEQELGLDISDEQIAEMREHLDDIDFEAAAKYERELRHDVMAHVHALGDVAPKARPIIHLGATSCYVTDNGDLMVLRDALDLIARRLAAVILALADFAEKHRDLPCLGYTHFQPAQPTTVGKRATLWAYDLVLDLEEVETRRERLKARSAKGTTGTQASFLQLFDGDHEKVRTLERRIAQKMGFDGVYAVTGQTYPRKVDVMILDALSGVAQSCHKAATDIRLLAHRKEMEEPFEESQIGSSAMPYKRNPMRCERMCGLARFVMSLASSGAATAATQWMERTLDDSANRRLTLAQAFLAADATLNIYLNVARGLVVYPAVIARSLQEELPFMATESILMEAVRQGGDRQELHEAIRQHSHAAAATVKRRGLANDLIDRLKADARFAKVNIDSLLDADKFIGRAPQQVDAFIANVVGPIRQRHSDAGAQASDLHV